MRVDILVRSCLSIAVVIGTAGIAVAQSPQLTSPETVIQDVVGEAGGPLQPDAAITVGQSPEAETRQTLIEDAAADRAKTLHPYVVTTAEKAIARIERRFTNQTIRWHTFLQNGYQGGGFAAGAGYMFHTSSYSTLDVRSSYSMRSYKLAEAEFTSPRLFDRRGELTVLGGWRDATQVAFYGFGMQNSSNDRANYGFEQPYASALLKFRPTRRLLMVRGGFEAARWNLKSGKGIDPSLDEIYPPAALPGLGTTTTYLHTQATVGFDSRLSKDYARRGGFYGVTGHDYSDRDDALGFRLVEYEAIQHVPILRESWVLSLHGLVKTTWDKGDQETPFYMMPSLGGGSNLRGFSSFRYADRNSLLLQGEWRIIANRFFESAAFVDAGKVTNRTSDLDLRDLKTDYGFGVRFHAPLVTVLRVDVARSNEGTRLVFAASPAF